MQPQIRLETPEVADHLMSEEGSARGNSELMYLKSLARTLLVELDCLAMNQPHEIANGISFNDEVERFEIGLIKRALARTGGNQRRAARLLGLVPTTLCEKIKRYGINAGRVRRREDATRAAASAAEASPSQLGR